MNSFFKRLGGWDPISKYIPFDVTLYFGNKKRISIKCMQVYSCPTYSSHILSREVFTLPQNTQTPREKRKQCKNV